MNKILSFYLSLFIMLAVLLFYQGCADLSNNVTNPSKPLGYHPAGWLDTTSANFHGNTIKAANWSFLQCKTCHGLDYKGGSVGISCFKCHTQSTGPEACNTCHGSRDPSYLHNWPPQSLNHLWGETERGVGSHNHHLSPNSTERYSKQVPCIECHAQVNTFSDTNHIDTTRHGAAKLTFGPLAHTIFHNIVPNPSYDSVSNTCSSVYCHGYFYGGNQNFKPVFNDPNSVTCGSCHGNPVTGDPTPLVNGGYEAPHFAGLWNDSTHHCYWCHYTIDSTGTIIAPSLHIDGVVEHYEPKFNVKGNINSIKQYYIRQKSKK